MSDRKGGGGVGRYVRKKLSRRLWRLPERLFVPWFRKRLITRGTDISDFRRETDARLYRITSQSREAILFVSERERLKLFTLGISHRLEQLAADYSLTRERPQVSPGDIVVDCGANIGEIGLWLRETGATYVAFEPDPSAFAALRRNMPEGDLHQEGLSDRGGSVEFYLAPASADSSIIHPSNAQEVGTAKIDVTTLDDFCSSGDISHIRLLKVEAEGFEPEVLYGARWALSFTDYVAVDASPERLGQSPAPECVNFLFSLGFRLVALNLQRGSFLFERSLERAEQGDARLSAIE